jgi:hypothetical protein
MSTDIQNKVVTIASNKAVQPKAKLTIRKQFYDLKIAEIELEAAQEDFSGKAREFEAQLNDILGQLKLVSTVDEPEPVEEEKEEIIMVPKKPVPKVAGMQVRMQEELDTTDEDTDFEVPFEVDEK